MDTLWQDFRFAVRMLASNRTTTLIAVLCLALGIGANTATFSLVDSILFAPLPFRDPGRVVTLFGVQPKLGVERGAFSIPDLLDIRAESRTLSDAAIFGQEDFAVADSGAEADRVEGARVSTSLFRVLGVPPARGRDFREGEDAPGRDGVVIISDRLWRTRYQTDPGILGRVVRVNGVAHTVIGVMPVGFRFPFTQQLWVPLGQDPATVPRGIRWGDAIGRLAPGATVAQADADVRAIASRVADRFPTVNTGRSARVVPFRDYLADSYTVLISALLEGAVAFVLLIVCANVANLALARSMSRERELMVRSALGAGRGRLMRQLLTESLVTAALGGALGILVASWAMDGMLALIPVEIPFWVHMSINTRVLVFTAVATMLSGLVFGLAPAWQMSRATAFTVLKEGARGSTTGGRTRLRQAFVIAQLAMSIVLLIGATLTIKGVMALRHRDTGFDPSPVLAADVMMRSDGQGATRARTAFARQLGQRLAAEPGVISAGAINPLPLSGGAFNIRLLVEGHPVPLGEEEYANAFSVTDGAFGALGLRPVSGRLFSNAEYADSVPVAVIGAQLAQRYWPAGDAVGGRVRLGLDSSATWYTIIGVVPTIRPNLIDAPDPQVYLPYPAAPRPQMTIVARVAAGRTPASLAPGIRAAVRDLDPLVPVYNVFTLDDVLTRSIWGFRFVGQLLGVFAVIAFFLATIGVYGVIAFSVAQRTREVGVRIALGAQASDVVRLVLRQGAMVIGAGMLIGLAGAAWLARGMSSLLFGVSRGDPAAFIGIPLSLAAVALFASWLPARRATRVDPVEALRHE